MILNPDMFHNIIKQTSPKQDTLATKNDHDTPNKPSFKFESFSAQHERNNLVADSVNLMIRSSKKSCEKYRPPEIQKPTTKREVLDSPTGNKNDDEMFLAKVEEIPEYNSKIDY